MFRKFSFRRQSFANSLILQFGLLMLLALAVFGAGSYRLIVRPTVDDLARAQMGLVSEQLEARLSRLLQTVEVTLRSSRGWGVNGDLDHTPITRFNEFFFPIIAHHDEISSVVFAHESGREILLLLNNDGTWVNRISNPLEWGKTTYWLTWNKERQLEKVEVRELDYDARQRPWFAGAMGLVDDQAIHWTTPYIFTPRRNPASLPRCVGRVQMAVAMRLLTMSACLICQPTPLASKSGSAARWLCFRRMADSWLCLLTPFE
ncbi:MAG: hypothetical protein IPJ38_08785 [Dechloromonas sp.]|uniref:Uncharacterized protein n=1 Tax=Candidatus Dechloromonas phosphorivorans TaxID=2899244 RepID=A0A935MT17_9RHOO|nr:hypothetical protein [Candidatus Dechloromonas phosphorivorans]